MSSKVLLIYGHTNNHLGLWNDLKEDTRVILRTTEPRELNWFMNRIKRIYKKIPNIAKHVPIKHLFYQYIDIIKIIPHVQHLLVIDGALKFIDISELNKCRRKNKELKISLYLINSVNANSPIMKSVIPKIPQFKWDKIYTFDANDAKQYGFTHLGFNYYSSHSHESSLLSTSDVFFVGGLKGGRTEIIYNLYTYLSSHGVRCDFHLMPIENLAIKHLAGICYCKSWQPYEEILEKVQQTNCIIEIVQEGQSGATLRYFEAVTMNKKLLTNNPHIKEFPLYNPKWMKTFQDIEDIDMEWLLRDEKVDYGYQGEFSPTHLIDYVTNGQR